MSRKSRISRRHFLIGSTVGGVALRAGTGRALASLGDTDAPPFPLRVSANSRYLTDRNGSPFFVHGDSIWSLEVQCTRAQIDRYLDNCKSLGFNAVLFQTFEHLFSNQTPPYVNAEGNKPFTTMSGRSPPYTVDFSTLNNSYWGLLDYIVAGAAQRGIVCFITPCYYGFAGTQEGWSAELTAVTQANRIAYGNALAARYLNATNIVWVMGGDNISGASLYDDIRTGMTQVATNHLITYHAARSNDGYSAFGGHAGFNVNSQYSSYTSIVSNAATAYGRSGPLPFIMLEDNYEGVPGQTNLNQRQQAYQCLCGGGCGHFYGNDPLWSLGAAADTFGPNLGKIGVDATLNRYLNTTARKQQLYVKQLWTSLNWWLLQPKTDTSWITTSKGSGASALTGALGSDGSFGVVYTPMGTGFTVNLAALSIGTARALWFDPTNGALTIASGSPFTNSGTQAFSTPGKNSTGDSDWVLVVKA